MRKIKRITSIILAALMVVSLFVAVPATASATTAAYVKVTSAPSDGDWSGDYLIVYEDYNKAFNGGLDTLDAAKNTIDVTINSDVIASNTTTDAAKVTIAAISGGYSIKSASGYYIGGQNGSNKLNSSVKNDYVNTFAIDNGDVTITSNTSVLGFNTAGDQLRFRYFKSSSASGKYVQLYKLTGGSAPATYTVTWKNGDDVLETDNDVAFGATPTYDGTSPEKAEDADNTYEFSGWYDGTTTYGLSDTLPNVTADVTYTAQFTAVPKTPELPDVIKDCTYQIDGEVFYSNVPFTSESNLAPLEDGAIIFGSYSGMLHTVDAMGYSYKFYDQTGTEIPVTLYQKDTFLGSNLGINVDVASIAYQPTFPADLEAIYIVATATAPEVINYGGEDYIKPDDKVDVSDSDTGALNFGLNLDKYFNMQMLGIQKKSAIATQGGDDGIRFVTAVNSKLLKGDKIADYGYIVVKANEGTSVDTIYQNMDKLTYNAVGKANRFSCKGTSNTISGDFGNFNSNTDYKYVTLSITDTQDSTDTIAARFYVKTTDGQFYYANYVKQGVARGGMAFKLSDVNIQLD